MRLPELKKTWLPDNISEFLRHSLWPSALIACLGLLNFWAALGFTQTSPLSSESAKHLSKAYQMAWQIDHLWPWSDILNTITYPPCFYLNTAYWFQIFQNKSEALALLSVVPYLIISAWSVHGLIKNAIERSQNFFLPFVGSLTCLALLSSSLLTEGYLIEYALTAWLSASFYLFTSISGRKISYWQVTVLITVCSLGLLTKWTFLSYLFPLITCLLIDISINIVKKRYTSLEISSLIIKAAILLTAVIFLGGLWYGARHGENSNLSELLAHFSRSQNSEKIIQTNDPIFLHGFRAHSPSLYKFGPLNFALYTLIHVIPPHLGLMLLIGVLIAISRLCTHLHLLYVSFGLKNGTKQLHQTFAHSAALKVFTTPETIITISLFSSLFFYSLYPTPALFVPEKSVRHLAPLAPAAIALAFIWLSKLDRQRFWLLLPCLVLSTATLFHWAIPQNSAWRGHILLGQGLPRTTLHQFRDPLGLVTNSYNSPLEKLCYQIAKKAQNKEIIVSLINKEDFDPFFTELYAYLGPKPVILLNKYHHLTWIDPLTQVPIIQPPNLKNRAKLIVQRYQVTWLGYPQIQTVPELPHNFAQVPISKSGSQNLSLYKYFYILRAGQIDAYRISESQ